MKVKEKKVYYCEHCKKHGLRAANIQEHEIHCTANPNRVCGLCARDCAEHPYSEEIAKIRASHDWLMTMRGKDGVGDSGISGTHCKTHEDFVLRLLKDLECPPCALAIVRQTGISSYMPYYDFKDEMQKYFEQKHKEQMLDDYYSM